jgi:hypothetical protein
LRQARACFPRRKEPRRRLRRIARRAPIRAKGRSVACERTRPLRPARQPYACGPFISGRIAHLAFTRSEESAWSPFMRLIVNRFRSTWVGVARIRAVRFAVDSGSNSEYLPQSHCSYSRRHNA